MRDLLSPRGRAVLEPLAWSRVLVAFDFDGTLAPIVDRPEDAAMRPRTRRLLAAVSRRYPVVVISGRARTDIRARLGGIGVRQVIGNHGIEPAHATDRLARQVRKWIPPLRARLAPFQGVRIEDKGYSVAVHYRTSRRKRLARQAILEAASSLERVRIIGGKMTLNILPEGAPHKGIAIEQARSRLACDTIIYVGDDETDEDVFNLDQPGRLLSVRVGRGRSSAASYYIRDQAAIDRLLALLADLRDEAARSRRAAR
jgi:trehalose 6-phosphate phosphatase